MENTNVQMYNLKVQHFVFTSKLLKCDGSFELKIWLLSNAELKKKYILPNACIGV